MADILLLQGGGHWDTFKSHPEIPLGLLSASVFLHQDYAIKIIDMRYEKKWRLILREELAKKPFMAGVSCMIGKPIRQALDASRIIKDESSVPVVWGGPGPTSVYETTIKHPLVDIVVRGEGEYTMKELADALRSGKSLHDIKGLVFKENGKIVVNEERGFCNLNELPMIPYHLVDIERYKVMRRGIPSISIETSRGCPHRCKFCCNSYINHHTWRSFSAEEALRRIEHAVTTLGVNGFFIIDDNFFVNLNRARAILQGLVDRNLQIKHEIQGARIDTLDRMSDDDVELLCRSGCQRLIMGLESGSQKILDFLDKGYKVEQLIRVNRRFSQHAIDMSYNVMAGYPVETNEDLKATIDVIFKVLAENKHATTTSISCLQLHPSTQLFEDYKDQIKSDITLDELADLDYDHALYPWMTPEQKKFMEAVSLTSYFIDDKVFNYVHSPVIKLFAYFYRPLARWRFKNLNFKFMFEMYLRKLALKAYGVN
jgi:anaerobic magnesium-protoporphyrin IX monomethyl ester cyclase